MIGAEIKFWIEQVWEEHNRKAFDGHLQPPLLLLVPSSELLPGEYAKHYPFPKDDHPFLSIIRIIRTILTGEHEHFREGDNYLKGRQLVVKDLLLHEMVHQFIYERMVLKKWNEERRKEAEKKELEFGGHGPVFAAKCIRVAKRLEIEHHGEKNFRCYRNWPQNKRPKSYFREAWLTEDQMYCPETE